MKINSSENSSISFKGIYNSKILLKGLKYAGEKPALVATGTTLFFSTIVRPIAILLTPDTSKDDKHLACTKSIASGGLGAALTASIFTPLSNAVNKITETPEKYLTSDTIKNLKKSAKNLDEAQNYNFIRQLLKLSPEILAIIPKALLTTALIIPLAGILFNKKDSHSENKYKIKVNAHNKASKPSFAGASSEKLTKTVVSIFDNKNMQKLAEKYKDSNFIQHALNLKDVFATACFAVATSLNPKIKKDNKSALIYNSALSTGLTIGGGYLVNRLVDSPVKKFTEKFAKTYKDDPDLYKYLNGIKVIKPIVILSSIYYIFIPMVSTFWADRLVRKKAKIASASAK